MTSQLQDIVDQLERALPTFYNEGQVGDFARDVYGAIDDLLDLGRRLLAADTTTNYPARVQQEQELWAKLKVKLRGQAIYDAARYRPIFDLAGQLLSIAQSVRPSKEGHLGFLAIAREQFGFLQADYGFAVVSEEPVKIRFSSGRIYVELACAKNASSSCSFGCESNPDRSFWIDDLLYLHCDKRYKSLPEELVLDSQNTVARWVAFFASVFRQYGHDVLTDRSGIFGELAAAQEARDREYGQEIDRQC